MQEIWTYDGCLLFKVSLLTQPQANVAGTSNGGYIIDSGVSNHVKNELGQLNLATDYTGIDSFVIGNGQGLRISHIGTSIPS